MRKILVVDDEPGILGMIQFDLTDDKMKVVTARGAAEALKLMEGSAVDLVITDMRMPGMDGLDLINALRKSHPEMPVILMTGFMEERVKEVLILPRTACLQKPFTLDQLRGAVDRFLPNG